MSPVRIQVLVGASATVALFVVGTIAIGENVAVSVSSMASGHGTSRTAASSVFGGHRVERTYIYGDVDRSIASRFRSRSSSYDRLPSYSMAELNIEEGLSTTLLGTEFRVATTDYRGKQYKGLKVGIVSQGTTACRCGLKQNDFVLSASGVRLLSELDLMRWLTSDDAKPGAKLVVIRGDRAGFVTWKEEVSADSVQPIVTHDLDNGREDDSIASNIEVSVSQSETDRKLVRVTYQTSGGSKVYQFRGKPGQLAARLEKLPESVRIAVQNALKASDSPKSEKSNEDEESVVVRAEETVADSSEAGNEVSEENAGEDNESSNESVSEDSEASNETAEKSASPEVAVLQE